MRAQEAFEISLQKFATQALPSTLEAWQAVVRQAAENGQVNVHIGIAPVAQWGFVAHYFESLGYCVTANGVSPTHLVVELRWNSDPVFSRSYTRDFKTVEALTIPELSTVRVDTTSNPIDISG